MFLASPENPQTGTDGPETPISGPPAATTQSSPQRSQGAVCFAFSPARALPSQLAAINPRRQCSL